MKIHELNTAKTKGRRRVGRGTGSGKGKTAGRGMDGQNSRSGGGVRPGFEGGQNPYMKRIPKSRGFRNHADKPATVHTDELNQFDDGAKVGIDELKKAGLVSKRAREVKLLKRGELKTKINLEVDKSSKSAETVVTDAGGSIKIGHN